MGEMILIDTNVFIDLFNQRLPPRSSSFYAKVINEEIFYISVITQIELLSFNADEREASFLDEVISRANILTITQDVVERTIAIRKELKIKLPDAVIALLNDLTLISRNDKDIANVEDLKYLNPYV